MRKFLLGCVLFAWPGLALAQDQAPLIGSQATAPQTPAEVSQPALRRVLIVGDQLAGGMGAGLTRMADGDDTIEVVNRFNETSGLTRPEIYDWASAIPKMAEGKAFTAAFVLVGLNDRRDMRDGAKLLPFGSQEWAALYKTRVDAVIDALTQQKIKVFWMGEPPMGDAALDADMQMISAIVKERAAAKGATYLELRSPFLGADGKYSERGPDDTGADRRLRESDGVTFFKMGNNRLGQIALAALKAVDVPAVAGNAVAAPAPVAAAAAAAAPDLAPAPAPEASAGPIFGQQGLDGAVVSQSSNGLAAAVAQDAAIKAAAKSSAIGIAAAQGSEAEALFNSGVSAAPPAGRFDDFSAPAQQP